MTCDSCICISLGAAPVLLRRCNAAHNWMYVQDIPVRAGGGGMAPGISGGMPMPGGRIGSIPGGGMPIMAGGGGMPGRIMPGGGGIMPGGGSAGRGCIAGGGGSDGAAAGASAAAGGGGRLAGAACAGSIMDEESTVTR